MSASVDSVKSIFYSTALPIGPVMESVTSLQKWFLKRGNKILPVVSNDPVETGLESLLNVDLSITPGLTINITTQIIFDRAVLNARNTLKSPIDVTAQFLYSVARHLQKHQTVLALALSVDTKRSISEVRKYDIPLAIQAVYHYAGLSRHWCLESGSWTSAGVICIIPSTVTPLLDVLMQICPGLVAGNSMLVLSPLTSTRTISVLMDILLECGLNRGSIAFLPFVECPSFEVGIDVLNVCDSGLSTAPADTLLNIRTAMLSGKISAINTRKMKSSVAVVVQSADLESAAVSVIESAIFAGGKSQFSTSKVFVQESCYERFLLLLQERHRALRSGHFLDKTVDYSSWINQDQFGTLQDLIQNCKTEGTEIFQQFSPTSSKESAADNISSISCPFILAEKLGLPSKLCTESLPFPFLAVFPFRTIKEAIALVNNAGPCSAVGVWTENVAVSMELSRFVKSDTVWINSSLLFDSAISAGKKVILDYARLPCHEKERSSSTMSITQSIPEAIRNNFVDRTYKLYFGGAQKRPDSGTSITVEIPKKGANTLKVHIPEGGQKDMKSAIDAAVSGAALWATNTPFNRSQILFFIAENLGARVEEFVQRLLPFHRDREEAQMEVLGAIERLSFWAGVCNDITGKTHVPSQSTCVISLSQPVGVIGIAVPNQFPLLSLVTLFGAALANGNSVVVVPSVDSAIISLEFCQILETSDVPPGVINIVTGNQDGLVKVFALHREVGAVWDFRDEVDSQTWSALQSASLENSLKLWRQPAVNNWLQPRAKLWDLFLHHSSQHKLVWIPTVHSFVN